MSKRIRMRMPARSGDDPLTIVYRPIGDLKPDPANPRRHSKKQIRQIADSIETFGFNVPILIDAERKVIAGHGRLLACHELGWTEVPTLCLDHLTPAQARAFMIADNRLSEIASWDDRLLAEQLKDLSLPGSISVSRSPASRSARSICGSLRSTIRPTQAADPADAVPEVASGPAVSKPGDLWLLGRHRVLCGNVLDIAASRTFDGRAARRDGVYRPALQCADRRPRDRARCDPSSLVRDGGGRDEPARLCGVSRHQLCATSPAFSAGGALLYVCIDWRHLGELLAAGREADARLENLCVWVKDNAGMGSLYRSQHELIFVFKTGRGRHRNNVQLGRFGRSRSNVWHYPGANSFSRKTEEGNLLALHPTVKPVALVADAILDCTAHGDIVLDGFLGSGTTVIAAERTGRRCYGLELDPGYVDTIIRRWQALTGGIARHADSGRSFDDLAREAEVGDAA